MRALPRLTGSENKSTRTKQGIHFLKPKRPREEAMVVQQQTFEEFLTRAGDHSHLEVHQGRLREKPEMSFDHGDVMTYLGIQLGQQIDRKQYRVHVNNGRVRRTERTYYIPDIIVIPLHLAEPFRGKRGVLEIYDEPLPLVVEVWSESTGDYDVDAKL